MVPYDAPATEEVLRRIALEPNPWIALQRLENELGRTSYTEAIRDALRPASSVAIPRAYDLLWRLRPAGFMNLNLDRLASRSFHGLNGDKTLAEFESTSVGNHTHVLQSLSQFVYNMHGAHEDSSTWVLTHDEMKDLLSNEAYNNFVKSTLSTSVVLFVGLSVDDVAVGGHLERLVKAGIQTGTHYWVSSRTDIATDRWAEAAGIRMIRYTSSDDSHAELEQMLGDLHGFVPPEQPVPAPPVVANVQASPAELPAPSVLAARDAESIREALNGRAAVILNADSEDSFSAFEAFVQEYDEAIHRAWYTSLAEGKNKLMGYALQSEVARGAFGRVFKAQAPDGTPVAIKLLHSELRQEPELLLAFRRGVRSMSILHSRGVHGVVTYREASEIPAFAVMDWVEGADLNAAVRGRRLGSWPDILKAASGIAEVIGHAHAVPERVLHRDIRPANIMLEGVWNTNDWRVVILDFDLSWHQGAYQHSVIHGSGTAGYLAPEQIKVERGISARHAAVDSFGLGMTLYFMIAATDPLPAQHLHTNWRGMVHAASRRIPANVWLSLPARFSRLVIMATMDRQSERLDLAQIRIELARLQRVQERPAEAVDPDLAAEELAARAESMIDYSWDQDRIEAMVQRPSGLTIRVAGEEVEGVVRARLEWSTAGTEDRKRLGRWISGASQTAAAALTKGGWRLEERAANVGSMTVVAAIEASALPAMFDRCAAALDRAADALRFE